jgi:hypothetical protein
MEVAARGERADLEWVLRRDLGGFVLERAGHPPLRAPDEGRLLFAFEQELTLALQRVRRDLYFLHAAALALPEGAALFVGDSGAGKSTLAWGLLHHGFAYLSDELAPIEPCDLCVLPYQRSLCLKEPPPGPYALPPDAVETSRGLRVPMGEHACRLPGRRRICAIYFLEPGAAAHRSPTVRPMSTGEAAARLLANVLNPLAHPADGLDPALAIARNAPGFALRVGALGATCELISESLGERPRGPADRTVGLRGE